MKPWILFAGLCCTLLISCHLPTDAPTPNPPTLTPPPATVTPLATATQTPTQLTLRVDGEKINCRFGPGVVYAFVNELSAGTSARVVGRNETATWWYIRDPGNPGGACWVSANVTVLEGDGTRLPVIPPPPVHVTEIRLTMLPERIFVPCNQFPQTIFFQADLYANGPTLVWWQLESSSGYISAPNEVIFEEAGIEPVNGYHQVLMPGDYWIRLRILKPNETSQQLNFPANCSP